MSHLHQDRKIRHRISRLKGQIVSIEQAIQQPDTQCMALLQQVAAIKGAVNGLLNELLESHLRHHVLSDTTEVNEEDLAAFIKLLKRYGD